MKTKNYSLSNTQIRAIRTGRGQLTYKFVGKSKEAELKLLDGNMRGAFNMADYCINKLQKGDDETRKNFELIFQKQFDRSAKQNLLKIYKHVKLCVGLGEKKFVE